VGRPVSTGILRQCDAFPRAQEEVSRSSSARRKKLPSITTVSPGWSPLRMVESQDCPMEDGRMDEVSIMDGGLVSLSHDMHAGPLPRCARH